MKINNRKSKAAKK